MSPPHSTPYARTLRPSLSAAAFKPARSRLLWLPAMYGVIALDAAGLASGRIPWAFGPLIALVNGLCFGCLTFLAHEVLHGAVVRDKRLRYVVGWLCFLPHVVAPRTWMAWHNRVHHGHANAADSDPDANPTLAAYSSSRTIRVITNHFAPGRRSLTAVLGFLVGFTFQAAHVLSFSGARGYLSRRDHRRACLETGLGVATWTAAAVAVGLVPFLFAFFVPGLLCNAIVLAFVYTNHGLSPLTTVDDPLANSLTVTSSRLVSWLTLGFGAHVEHHVFPWMSARHAPEVRALLMERWPDRYQSMPLGAALMALHRTARVYADQTTLLDPPSGRRFATLGAPEIAASPASNTPA